MHHVLPLIFSKFCPKLCWWKCAPFASRSAFQICPPFAASIVPISCWKCAPFFPCYCLSHWSIYSHDYSHHSLIMFLLLWVAYPECISWCILLPRYCPNSSHGDEHSNYHWEVKWPRFSHLANLDKVSLVETQLVEPLQGNFFLIKGQVNCSRTSSSQARIHDHCIGSRRQ